MPKGINAVIDDCANNEKFKITGDEPALYLCGRALVFHGVDTGALLAEKHSVRQSMQFEKLR